MGLESTMVMASTMVFSVDPEASEETKFTYTPTPVKMCY